MATEYGSRLKKARNHAGMTQMQASAKTGIPQSTISTAEREGHGSGDTPVYAKTYGVDAHWLATGEGEMLSPSPLFEKSDNVSPVPAFRMVPVLNTVNAGMYKEIVDTHPDDLEYTPVLGPIKRYTFALRVEGDSMAPAFKHGAVVIVDPDMPPKPKDFVIAVNGDNEATFKQLVKDGPDWYLKPLNNAYPIKPLGDAQIIGVVMALQVFSFRGDDTWPV
jgi:SOS-response transcriptional repressor LexA